MIKQFLLSFILISTMTFSQESLTVDETIDLAVINSMEGKKVLNELKSSQANYNLFQKTYLPNIYASTIFPSISNSVTRVTTPEGEDIFVNQNQAYYDLSLNLEQREPLLGGTFTLSSFLNRIDLFGLSTTRPISQHHFQYGMKTTTSPLTH